MWLLELHLRSFLTMVLDGVNDQLHALAALILDNPPNTHLLGGGMGHRASMNTLNKKSSR